MIFYELINDISFVTHQNQPLLQPSEENTAYTAPWKVVIWPKSVSLTRKNRFTEEVSCCNSRKKNQASNWNWKNKNQLVKKMINRDGSKKNFELYNVFLSIRSPVYLPEENQNQIIGHFWRRYKTTIWQVFVKKRERKYKVSKTKTNASKFASR